jgi:hypothetical protein
MAQTKEKWSVVFLVTFQFLASVADDLKFTIWFDLSEDGPVPPGLLGVPLTGICDENQRKFRLWIMDQWLRNQNCSELSESFIGLRRHRARLPGAVLPHQGIERGGDLGKVLDMSSEEVA